MRAQLRKDFALSSEFTWRARHMRRHATDAERAMWALLRNRQLGGYKFRRQYPVNRYIVDFVCLQQGLIIEVDGSQHQSQAQEDQNRTASLESQGFRVLRFWNNDVLTSLDAVAGAILTELEQSQMAEGPSP